MLFRAEAIEGKRLRITGKVLLIQPLSIYLISIFIFVLLFLVITYLSMFEYDRKETVKGYLVPKHGVIKTYSGKDGVLEELFVKEGDIVSQGQPIARIRNSQSLSSGIELSIALATEINNQIEALDREISIENEIFVEEMERINNQLVQLRNSLIAIKKVKKTAQRRLSIKESRLSKNKHLFDKGFMSKNQLFALQEEYLEALELTERLDKEISATSVDISSLESEKMSLPNKILLKKTLIERNIYELSAQKVRLNSQFEIVKKAPQSGLITTIQSLEGSQIYSNTPLLSIIPIDSPLEIELLLPTRAAGFVELGDLVNIRFDAFPYQKFGVTKGEIISIEKSLILPNEKNIPIKVGEAMYRVRAKLNKQYITAYGSKYPLKVGMFADGDIVVETRTLLDWLLDPIYAIKGKLG